MHYRLFQRTAAPTHHGLIGLAAPLVAHLSRDDLKMRLLAIYLGIDAATVVFLTFFDDFEYTWWNWLIALPVNSLLGGIWPLYWSLLRPIGVA